MEKQKNAVGRRKEAVTRVFLSKGEGKITVNDKDYKDYFPLVYLQNQVEAPLKTVESSDKFDVTVNAKGGGGSNQSGSPDMHFLNSGDEFGAGVKLLHYKVVGEVALVNHVNNTWILLIQPDRSVMLSMYFHKAEI